MKKMSLMELANKLDGKLVGDGNTLITEMANLATAQPHQLSFLSNAKFKDDLITTKAGGVLIKEADAATFNGNAIIVADPYVAFAKAAQLLDSTPVQDKGIAATATVSDTAKIGENVSIGAGAVVSANAELADNVVIGPNCFVGEGAKLGRGVNLRSNVTIYHRVQLGDRVSIHSGTVVGSDGFGYANDKGNWVKIPQTGTVIIGNDTEIGSNTSIDRGTLDDTIIGTNCIIDNLVHIAHNCVIGDHTCICGTVGMAGSVKIGKYVIIAGQCAINGHISICDNVQLTGCTMVIQDITEPGVYSSGIPSQPNREWRKNTVHARQLTKMASRIKTLERALDK